MMMQITDGNTCHCSPFPPVAIQHDSHYYDVLLPMYPPFWVFGWLLKGPLILNKEYQGLIFLPGKKK